MAKKKQAKDVDEVSDLITQVEAAQLRNVTVSAVNNWISRGHIRGFKKFGRTLVSRSEVMSYTPSKGGRPKTPADN